MNPVAIDRGTFLRNLRTSKLLSKRQFRLVVEKLGHVANTREIAKALATWKLVTKFQAKMLLLGRKSGFLVGPYRILDELGHGGMGRVYQAVHETMERVVALKILAPQMLDTERAQAMFLREIRAAAQLSHPNIVMAFDANEVDGRHYLAMEYVDGPNLEQYVQGHGALPAGLACEIIFQAASGLQHAHEKGVVHRDIKPANLLVRQDPGARTIQVKILDFGLARLRFAGPTAVNTKSSEEHTVMGTPDYVAPEQIKDLHGADIRADLYSLGCTLYFLLTAQVPFPGGNILEKLNRHDRTQARPIEELRPDVPRSVANLVRKLMAKNPGDRCQTPDELMDALAPYADPTATLRPLVQSAATSSPPEPRNGHTAAYEAQVDTEPCPNAATQFGEQNSILQWIDANRQQRRAGDTSTAH
jgi:serine/threonine-protein kinase